MSITKKASPLQEAMRCGFVGREGTAYISEEAERAVHNSYSRYTSTQGREVMGVLVGERYYHGAQALPIWLILGASLSSVGDERSAPVDMNALNAAMRSAQELIERLDLPGVSFLGLWHSHPDGIGVPSYNRGTGDIGVARNLLRSNSYLPDVLMAIAYHAYRGGESWLAFNTTVLLRNDQRGFRYVPTAGENEIRSLAPDR